MITLLYIALEAVAVLLLLHALYGKKMRWDKYSVGFVVLDCVLMSVIKWHSLNQNLSFIIYVVLIGYCFFEFKSTIKQMIINMIFGVIEPDLQSHYRKCINAVQSLIDYDLEQINHYIYRTEDGKYLVVQKDAAASAVADIVAPELADAIIEYNHHLLKGDLKSKKLILKQIADALEPRRAELKTVNKTIENDFFYMVNTMNVRHNNCDVSDPSKYNEKFANLTDREKEEWYDEIYQEGLMAYLSLEQVDREKKILDFKTKQKK